MRQLLLFFSAIVVSLSLVSGSVYGAEEGMRTRRKSIASETGSRGVEGQPFLRNAKDGTDLIVAHVPEGIQDLIKKGSFRQVGRYTEKAKAQLLRKKPKILKDIDSRVQSIVSLNGQIAELIDREALEIGRVEGQVKLRYSMIRKVLVERREKAEEDLKRLRDMLAKLGIQGDALDTLLKKLNEIEERRAALVDAEEAYEKELERRRTFQNRMNSYDSDNEKLQASRKKIEQEKRRALAIYKEEDSKLKEQAKELEERRLNQEQLEENMERDIQMALDACTSHECKNEDFKTELMALVKEAPKALEELRLPTTLEDVLNEGSHSPSALPPSAPAEASRTVKQLHINESLPTAVPTALPGSVPVLKKKPDMKNNSLYLPETTAASAIGRVSDYVQIDSARATPYLMKARPEGPVKRAADSHTPFKISGVKQPLAKLRKERPAVTTSREKEGGPSSVRKLSKQQASGIGEVNTFSMKDAVSGTDTLRNAQRGDLLYSVKALKTAVLSGGLLWRALLCLRKPFTAFFGKASKSWYSHEVQLEDQSLLTHEFYDVAALSEKTGETFSVAFAGKHPVTRDPYDGYVRQYYKMKQQSPSEVRSVVIELYAAAPQRKGQEVYHGDRVASIEVDLAGDNGKVIEDVFHPRVKIKVWKAVVDEFQSTEAYIGGLGVAGTQALIRSLSLNGKVTGRDQLYAFRPSLPFVPAQKNAPQPLPGFYMMPDIEVLHAFMDDALEASHQGTIAQLFDKITEAVADDVRILQMVDRVTAEERPPFFRWLERSQDSRVVLLGDDDEFLELQTSHTMKGKISSLLESTQQDCGPIVFKNPK
ncbi:hypothetical protein [Sansalvadorimonas verongulae]|uniref:hypothetical protein n=1 Tax=Sansalvadorimonas verongulae TaxID=2172824 RepID=UPI0012BB569E|nr:hypothetical protein [Sansalvadorimonas verongulae]MTI13334.1 hypothetical protein [Sansalvadorimonas verongulae]